jgi:hypothetical protein
MLRRSRNKDKCRKKMDISILIMIQPCLIGSHLIPGKRRDLLRFTGKALKNTKAFHKTMP